MLKLATLMMYYDDACGVDGFVDGGADDDVCLYW